MWCVAHGIIANECAKSGKRVFYPVSWQLLKLPVLFCNVAVKQPLASSQHLAFLTSIVTLALSSLSLFTFLVILLSHISPTALSDIFSFSDTVETDQSTLGVSYVSHSPKAPGSNAYADQTLGTQLKSSRGLILKYR